ncbi:MAG: enoyl-CoA hydratase-related protein [Caulobacteraceae bacterium]|nr:enoyl-CoA hydratase-related protein [Caulobacteraceae bacterium]
MFETLDYALEAGVARLVLNRPERHNAINSVMSRELPLAWARFEADPAARVAIVIGAGDRAFCTGADIADLPQADDPGRSIKDQLVWTPRQARVTKPVICAVNGMVVGGGLHFVADCDVVIASENASFFDTHVRVGLVAGLEPVALARKIPLDAVLRMALMGGSERLSARRALEIGLVGECVAPEALGARAGELADAIKAHAPQALARTKAAIWQSLELPLEAALDRASALIAEHNAGPEFAEGQAAFREGRAPNWAGRP